MLLYLLDYKVLFGFEPTILLPKTCFHFCKRRGLVFWNSPQQVGQDVYKWVTETGQTNTVMTLTEILEEGDNNSWRGVSQEVLIKALKTLECDKKCEIFEGGDGVKFF